MTRQRHPLPVIPDLIPVIPDLIPVIPDLIPVIPDLIRDPPSLPAPGEQVDAGSSPA